jgi:hypothetical protein
MIITRKDIGKHKSRVMRGLQYFSVFITLWTAAGLLFLVLSQAGIIISHAIITLVCIYAGGSASFLLLCYMGGWFDETKGIWKHENDYSYEVTPYSKEMLESIRQIRLDVDTLKKQIEDDGK